MRKQIGNFRMTRDGFNLPSLWITPDGVRAAFAFEIAAMKT